jgi:TatD DNase family protein
MLVDVHTHLTHERFALDREAVIARAVATGLGAIIVNGLEPYSNREILQMAAKNPVIRPALGIYPVNAVNDLLANDFSLAVERFDVEAEIKFIREKALAGELIAVGECGLDGHWLNESTFKAQEHVFESLLEVAKEADIPVIIHTRKLEQRCVEILRHHESPKVDFHCFGGRVKLAQECAEKDGWSFSIPANARVNEAFRKMLMTLPLEFILTETDAPYLAPRRGERNEPANVKNTVEFLGELRSMSYEEAKDRVWQNFQKLFGALKEPQVSA